MTAFEPTTRIIHPPLDDDSLGSAIVMALRRDVGMRLTISWPITLALGLLTAGLAPLLIFLLRLRIFCIAQKFQLEHVTEWFQSRDVGAAIQPLQQATDRLRGGWGALIAAGLAAGLLAFAAALLHLWLGGWGTESLTSLLSLYRPTASGGIFAALVVAGYVCHLSAVAMFARRVTEFVHVLKNVTQFDIAGQPEVRPLAADWPWLLGGAVLLVCGIAWGLPMMVAGAVHKRYINDISLGIRNRIAARIEALMRQPAPRQE